jgi:hypothetical protein
MTEVSIGYDHSPLNGPGSHSSGVSGPGHRLAPVAGQAPAGSGKLPRFALFATSSGSVTSLVRRYPDLIDAAIRPPLEPGVIVLVRPDGYVACVAKADDIDAFGDYLGKIGLAASVDA